MHKHNWEFKEENKTSWIGQEDKVLFYARIYKCSKCEEEQFVCGSRIYLMGIGMQSDLGLPKWSLWK